MNLTSLSQIFKKISIPILGAVIILSLFFLIWLRQHAQQQNVPPVLVFQWNDKPLNKNRAIQIASNFGIPQEPQTAQDAILGETYRWNLPEISLSIDRFRLNYKKTSPLKTPIAYSVRKIFTEEDLEQTIRVFLKQKGLLEDTVEINAEKISYYKNTPSAAPQKVSDISQADKINVLVTLKLGQYPLLDHNADQMLASLTITKEGEVTALSVRLIPELQPLEKYPVKSVDEAVKEILAGGGVIAGFKPSEPIQGEGETQIIRVSSLSITKVNLGYYLPIPEQAFLQPVYVFIGNVVTEDKKGGEISMILPAIKSQFLTNPKP